MEENFSASLFNSCVEEFFQTLHFKYKNFDEQIEISTVGEENELIEEFVSRVVWPSAISLANYFVSNVIDAKISLKESNVLELGAGTGLSSFVVSKLGTKKIVTTDLCQKSLDTIAVGKKRNESENISVQKLTWGSEVEMSSIKSEHGQFDFIIGADILYEPGSIPMLLQTLGELLSQDGIVILANHKHRFDPLEKRFNEELMKTDLSKIDPWLMENIQKCCQNAVHQDTDGVKFVFLKRPK